MTKVSQNSISFLPLRAVADLWKYRDLIIQMSRREIQGRYRGAMLGLLWSLFHPLIMLVVYTFVFSVVLKIRWGADADAGHGTAALYLFSGMIIMNLFTEPIVRASSLIVSNANYVKKVVFPLEIFPCIVLFVSFFHFLISFGLLLVFMFIAGIRPGFPLLTLPFVLAPLLLLTLGLSWVLASLGTYLRDIGQAMPVVAQILFFASPVIYPLEAVPERLRPWLMANPLTWIIESARSALFREEQPSWRILGIFLLVSATVAWSGYCFFQRTRKGFADVV